MESGVSEADLQCQVGTYALEVQELGRGDRPIGHHPVVEDEVGAAKQGLQLLLAAEGGWPGWVRRGRGGSRWRWTGWGWWRRRRGHRSSGS